jgi:hypothetical protein
LPLISPEEDNVSPAGKELEAIDQEYGLVPPAAIKVPEYEEFIVPLGNEDVMISRPDGFADGALADLLADTLAHPPANGRRTYKAKIQIIDEVFALLVHARLHELSNKVIIRYLNVIRGKSSAQLSERTEVVQGTRAIYLRPHVRTKLHISVCFGPDCNVRGHLTPFLKR